MPLFQPINNQKKGLFVKKFFPMGCFPKISKLDELVKNPIYVKVSIIAFVFAPGFK